ncbi:peptidylprolyl isomerase [Oryzihumus sp.]|uniref:peptidylprolyl isomerase n=1 Tax=Oryzihumus sp. TaxID=1968903 RepID=UPI002ED8A591
MSPKARDRARAKRRAEKRQAVFERRAAERARNRQVVAVVLAVLLVVGGLVGVSYAVNRGKGTATPATPSASSSSASPSPSVTRTLPPKSLAAGKTFVATITTNRGPITVQLDGTKAPQTVASFLQLAGDGYWANSRCHRLTTAGIFVLQCGDPTGTGNGNPGYGYGIENAPKDGKYPTGTLAMARTSDPNSNGGQFFIVYKDTQLPTDGGGYTIFGTVTSGLDIVKKTAAAGVQGGQTDGPPAQPISIQKVVVTEKKA